MDPEKSDKVKESDGRVNNNNNNNGRVKNTDLGAESDKNAKAQSPKKVEEPEFEDFDAYDAAVFCLPDKHRKSGAESING